MLSLSPASQRFQSYAHELKPHREAIMEKGWRKACWGWLSPEAFGATGTIPVRRSESWDRRMAVQKAHLPGGYIAPEDRH
jgi:hypothetical protein